MNSTQIKVLGHSIPEAVSVTIKEDGIIVFCNHAGTHVESLFSLDDDDSHTSQLITVCDACKAQYIAEEWVL